MANYHYNGHDIWTGGTKAVSGTGSLQLTAPVTEWEEVTELLSEDILANLDNLGYDFYMSLGRYLLDGFKPFVPYKTGFLSKSADRSLTNSKEAVIAYFTDYADAVYNEPRNYSRAVHPYATDHWDEAFFETNFEWPEQIAGMIIDKLK